jgi:hypothetical protein
MQRRPLQEGLAATRAHPFDIGSDPPDSNSPTKSGPVVNVANLAKSRLSRDNYVQKAKPERNYWSGFQMAVVDRLKSEHGVKFKLIIHGRPTILMTST